MKKGAIKDPRGGHVRLYWEIIDSPAWGSLAAADQRAYLALLRQLRSTNNGDLSLPITVARHFGIASSATLAKSLRALVAVGLAAVTRKGGCSFGGQRLPTLYRLTDLAVFASPTKHIDASKATNEWKLVSSKAHGRALIRAVENFAKADAEKLKTQLQKLNATASEIEAVGQKTASEIEAWPSRPLQKMKLVKTVKTAKKSMLAGA